MKNLEKRCEEQLEIQLKVTNSVKEHLAEAGFDSKYGARPLRRAIQQQIEDKLSSFIDNGVSRIVAALIAANDVAFFSEQIDHTAFAFIAPVDSDNRCKHNILSPIDFVILSRSHEYILLYHYWVSIAILTAEFL